MRKAEKMQAKSDGVLRMNKKVKWKRFARLRSELEVLRNRAVGFDPAVEARETELKFLAAELNYHPETEAAIVSFQRRVEGRPDTL